MELKYYPTIRFPDFKYFYYYEPYFGIKWVKFKIRRYCAYQAVRLWEEWINQNRQWQAFFQCYPNATYPLLHLFLDRRYSRAQQRWAIMKHNFQQAFTLFGQRGIDIFANKKSIILSNLEGGLCVCLNVNELDFREGFWMLSLRDATGVRLYNVTFGFLSENAVLCTSVQGARGDGAKEIVYQLTKSMYGLRPQQLMIHVLQYFVQAMNMNELYGIAQEYQIKRRWSLKKHVQTDYNMLWQEYHATLENGNWCLPLMPSRKNMEDIPSKKRSMYRKRYALLDKIQADISQVMQALPVLDNTIQMKEIV